MKAIFQLTHSEARRRALVAVAEAPDGVIVEIKKKTRSLEQNALMWSLLADVSAQVMWHGMWLKPEDWKNMFTASLKGQRSVPSIDGDGFVVLGQATSTMTVDEMTELVELIYAFGAEHEVMFCTEIVNY